MERWLSWSKAHDWKSCVPLKGTGGSNPPLSATSLEPQQVQGFLHLQFYFKMWLKTHLLRRDKHQPLPGGISHLWLLVSGFDHEHKFSLNTPQ